VPNHVTSTWWRRCISDKSGCRSGISSKARVAQQSREGTVLC